MRAIQPVAEQHSAPKSAKPNESANKRTGGPPSGDNDTCHKRAKQTDDTTTPKSTAVKAKPAPKRQPAATAPVPEQTEPKVAIKAEPTENAQDEPHNFNPHKKEECKIKHSASAMGLTEAGIALSEQVSANLNRQPTTASLGGTENNTNNGKPVVRPSCKQESTPMGTGANKSPSTAPAKAPSPARAPSETHDHESESDEADHAAKERLAKVKREAHARYMRFHRSLSSNLVACCRCLTTKT